MSELTPCPECQRHVRKTETSCPFCSQALSLSHLTEQVLPRSRLGRAATFAFGATLVSATALVGCGGESEGKKEGEGGTAAGGSASGGTNLGGTASGGADAGQSSGGALPIPLYGAPAAGASNEAGGSSSGIGGVGLVYGAPAAGSGNFGGCPGPPPK